MNRFDKMALAATIAAILLFAPTTFYMAQFYIQAGLAGTTLVIGITGWIIATFGPIAIAAWFWRWSKRAWAPWALHLMLLPLAGIIFHAGKSMLLRALDQPDFDAMLGAPINPAMLLFAVAIISYALALLYTKMRISRTHIESP